MRPLLSVTLSLIALMVLAACGSDPATPTPGPTATSTPNPAATQLMAYMDALEGLHDALVDVQDPDAPQGALEAAIEAARDVAAFTPVFASFTEQQMKDLLIEYGTQMQELNARVVQEAVRVAGMEGTAELLVAIQQGPAFAIASSETTGSREPTVNLMELAGTAADPLGSLLTPDDVREAFGSAGIGIVRRDLKEQAGSLDPSLTYVVELFRSNVFTEEGTARSLALTVAEYTSETSAALHARLVMDGMEPLEPAIGDTAASVEANAQGIGSMIAFRSGTWFVALHTAQPDGTEPLVDLHRLAEIARLVEGRLGS